MPMALQYFRIDKCLIISLWFKWCRLSTINFIKSFASFILVLCSIYLYLKFTFCRCIRMHAIEMDSYWPFRFHKCYKSLAYQSWILFKLHIMFPFIIQKNVFFSVFTIWINAIERDCCINNVRISIVIIDFGLFCWHEHKKTEENLVCIAIYLRFEWQEQWIYWKATIHI